jgi:hypothetical protein
MMNVERYGRNVGVFSSTDFVLIKLWQREGRMAMLKVWSEYQDCSLRRAPQQEEEFRIVQVRDPTAVT